MPAHLVLHRAASQRAVPAQGVGPGAGRLEVLPRSIRAPGSPPRADADGADVVQLLRAMQHERDKSTMLVLSQVTHHVRLVGDTHLLDSSVAKASVSLNLASLSLHFRLTPTIESQGCVESLEVARLHVDSLTARLGQAQRDELRTPILAARRLVASAIAVLTQDQVLGGLLFDALTSYSSICMRIILSEQNRLEASIGTDPLAMTKVNVLLLTEAFSQVRQCASTRQ